MGNHTYDTDFQIVVFSNNTGQQVILFVIFLLLYLICMMWNMLIIAVTTVDPFLQTPMYFFLRTLSFVDISYTSVTLPKLMDILLTGNNKISFIACMAQFYFFTSMACTEIFLLTAMAFDRYVAICKPLHYTVIMKRAYCILLVAGSCITGNCNSVLVTVVASKMSFCDSKLIDQLFCDIKPMLKIACGDTGTVLIMVYLETLLIGFCPFVCILLSYIKIVSNILKLMSTGNTSKTFSTCISHLIVLVLFYGTTCFVYMYPPSSQGDIIVKIFTVLFLAVTPTINPLIYSLRNKDMKSALKRIVISLLNILN